MDSFIELSVLLNQEPIVATLKVADKLSRDTLAHDDWHGSIIIRTAKCENGIEVAVSADTQGRIWTENHEEGGWSDRYYAVPLNVERNDLVSKLSDPVVMQLIARIQHGRTACQEPYDPLSEDGKQSDLALRRALLSIPQPSSHNPLG
jgi:hypothetical protein